jgi:hypothetical protein
MENKTAVEWLYNELTKVWYDVKSSKELLEKAKEMEKEQIEDSWYDGTRSSFTPRTFEEYYNETFKK